MVFTTVESHKWVRCRANKEFCFALLAISHWIHRKLKNCWPRNGWSWSNARPNSDSIYFHCHSLAYTLRNGIDISIATNGLSQWQRQHKKKWCISCSSGRMSWFLMPQVQRASGSACQRCTICTHQPCVASLATCPLNTICRTWLESVSLLRFHWMYHHFTLVWVLFMCVRWFSKNS